MSYYLCWMNSMRPYSFESFIATFILNNLHNHHLEIFVEKLKKKIFYMDFGTDEVHTIIIIPMY